jgi:amidophosphoribosyltransferase
MCGIAGIVGTSNVNQLLYDALTILQHRGQDAAGIMTCDAERIYLRKSNGLVRDVFHQRHMERLQGPAGIGHVRYPTAGTPSVSEAQPFYVNSPYGIALSHNGNLTNAQQLKRELYEEDLRHIHTGSDSEILLNVFAHELGRFSGINFDTAAVFKAVHRVHHRCKGAYAAVALIAGHGVLAFRDPNGIRPLVLGKRETDSGTEWMVVSESAALNVQGFSLERDIQPGEAVFIDFEGNVSSEQCASDPQHYPCIFEQVYLARPDSKIDDISVYKSRIRMGEHLASQIEEDWSHLDIDVVIPVPDTSRTAAMEVARHLDLKYREGFVKNRYIGRTFIMPGQNQRKKSVRRKLNAIDLEFHGKNVLLVDDSIVRGTTCEQIIEMARQSGAKKVYFASAAPAIRYPNVYGIDMPSRPELIAHNRTDEEVCEKIGADALIYQKLDALIQSCHEGNRDIKHFDTSVFDGQYVTGDINEEYFAALEARRSDEAKQKHNGLEQHADYYDDLIGTG